MNAIYFAVAIAIIVLSVPYLIRVRVGPSVFDRLIAMNALGTKLPLLFIVLGQIYDRQDMFVDIGLALLLLSFFSTLLIARHMRRPSGERTGAR